MARLARLLAIGLTAVGLTAAGGCSSFQLGDVPPWSGKSKVKEPSGPELDRMVAVWTETTYYAPGKPATRGFGGRLYFYDTQGESSPVEGQLIVYAYDDTGHDSGSRPSKTPDRKYVFTPEQFKRFESESPLGVSYSIWIPWDPHGGPTKSITLLPVFTSSAGKIVQGAQSLNVLPGPEAIETKAHQGGYAAAADDKPAWRERVGALATGAGDTADAERRKPAEARASGQQMRTMTIDVPPTLQQRLLSNPSAQAPETADGIQQTTIGAGELSPMQKRAAAYFAAQQNSPPPTGGRGDASIAFEGATPQGAGEHRRETASTTAPAGSTAESGPPPARFGWPKRRARGEPIVPPDRDRDPWTRYQ